MKTKEVIQLMVALLIFAIAGYLIYMQLAPKPAAGSDPNKLTYEKITPIDPEFSQEALRNLTNAASVKDFYLPPDLKSGVGNNKPFTPVN